MPTLAPRPTQQTPTTRRRRLSTRTKVIVAIAGSLLLHAVLLLVLGWVVPHWPHTKLKGNPPPIHLTFTSPKPTPPTAVQPSGNKKPDYIRTLDEQKADKPPDDPTFISDKDTKAASELDANGDKPLPTQEGRDIPTYDFDTRPYRAGKEAQDAASAAPAAAQPPDQPKQTPEKTKPAPHTKALHPPKPPSTPKPAGELAAVQPDTSPTPEPPSPDATPDEASMPPPVPRQSQRSAVNPSVTSPGQPHPPGYQPQTIKSKVSGNISNRGIAAPSAIGTPLGRYQKQLQDAVGELWYALTEEQMSVLAPGTLKVSFTVTRSGKVRALRVVSGKPNDALADVTLQSINEAAIPPIPPEVADTLPGGELEVDDFVFDLFPVR